VVSSSAAADDGALVAGVEHVRDGDFFGQHAVDGVTLVALAVMGRAGR
jgi:hypothetical protein